MNTGLDVVTKLHQGFVERKTDVWDEILHEKVRFLPPTYWQEWSGVQRVSRLMYHVSMAFDGFTYGRIWEDGDNIALEFSAKVEGLDCHGVDLVTLGPDGRIKELEVVMRPVKTISALREVMKQKVLSDPSLTPE